MALSFTITLMLSIPVVHAQTAEQNTYARFIRTGAEQIKKGDYQAARDSFEGALRITDSEAGGHLGLGIAYFHLKFASVAHGNSSLAVEIIPKESTAYQ